MVSLAISHFITGATCDNLQLHNTGYQLGVLAGSDDKKMGNFLVGMPEQKGEAKRLSWFEQQTFIIPFFPVPLQDRSSLPQAGPESWIEQLRWPQGIELDDIRYNPYSISHIFERPAARPTRSFVTQPLAIPKEIPKEQLGLEV